MKVAANKWTIDKFTFCHNKQTQSFNISMLYSLASFSLSCLVLVTLWNYPIKYKCMKTVHWQSYQIYGKPVPESLVSRIQVCLQIQVPEERERLNSILQRHWSREQKIMNSCWFSDYPGKGRYQSDKLYFLPENATQLLYYSNLFFFSWVLF